MMIDICYPSRLIMPAHNTHITQMKIKALKQTIMLLLSGESLPRVLMSVIRFCSNTDDHMLKKLLMLYWEVSKEADDS